MGESQENEFKPSKARSEDVEAEAEARSGKPDSQIPRSKANV